MKFLFSLFALVILTESCNSTKETVSESKTAISETKSSKEMSTEKNDQIGDTYKSTVITYKAQSRGGLEYIKISKDEILVSNDNSLKNMDKYNCKESDWNELERLLKTINVEILPKLEAPTNKRLFDGAASATLSVKQGDMLIQSSSFDHGQPPKQIEALVNKVLSMKEDAIKE